VGWAHGGWRFGGVESLIFSKKEREFSVPGNAGAGCVRAPEAEPAWFVHVFGVLR